MCLLSCASGFCYSGTSQPRPTATINESRLSTSVGATGSLRRRCVAAAPAISTPRQSAASGTRPIRTPGGGHHEAQRPGQLRGADGLDTALAHGPGPAEVRIGVEGRFRTEQMCEADGAEDDGEQSLQDPEAKVHTDHLRGRNGSLGIVEVFNGIVDRIHQVVK
jgi:hypothetical protein